MCRYKSLSLQTSHVFWIFTYRWIDEWMNRRIISDSFLPFCTLYHGADVVAKRGGAPPAGYNLCDLWL